MLFSLKRLKKIANLNIFSDQAVIDALINLGFEVDGISKLNEISGIKFGLILDITKNPDADNLSICKVQFADQIRQIQTAARNIAKNKQVIAFIPGSKKGKITFQAKKIRGHISEGMLASCAELGFNQELLNSELAKGVLVFEPIFDLKSDPLEILELNDLVLDIKLLWNRPDANSYLILALELSVFFNTSLDFDFINWEIKGKTQTNLKLLNKTDSQIFAMEISKAPKLALVDIFLLLKAEIKLAGLAQNFAHFLLIYTGQPCYLLETENITTKIELVYQNIQVNNKNDSILWFQFLANGKTVLIPEIFEPIIEENKNFLLILPKFDLLKVKQISQNLKKNTPKLRQLAKNYDLGTTFLSIIFLNFFLEKQEIDFYLPINFDKNSKLRKTEISLNSQELGDILGLELSNENIKKTHLFLEKIGYNFKESTVLPPFYRVDIEFFADYAADFLRFYGFDKLREKKLQASKTKISEIDLNPIKLDTLGYYEANSFLLIAKEENFNPLEFKSQNLATFPSQEHRKIRYSLAWQLAKIVEYNRKRKITDINLYEKGTVSEWNQAFALASTIYDTESLKKHLKILYNYNFDFILANCEFLEPGKSQFIYLDKVLVGWVGQLSSKYNYKNINFLEIIVSKLDSFAENKKNKVKFKPYENSQLKYRDITLSLEINDIPDSYLKVLEKIPEIFSIKLKDYIIIDGRQKITYRITGTDQVCQTIDKFYN
ncbi:phenylalanine--tRNA ligase subunit beta [Mycoplasma flocculare]|uniref:phenylalanine--tRNA ligase n=1 Tax=Mesomycoplasma flocculare TaxID=2128 RepID=A0AAW9XDU5_MESFC|nr:phenylalanine--tRNA ligase subunit beta [Mesomycoplasma flocculare]MXR06136.1 phenylalanine--tRNA ligase subunit beta [Mesomycoplasma flocculare]MXR39692.1 phenylalanine--tRNA ligase subunit beta [Mycoplasma sp. MF12]MXR56344.1 phenylalanine--tRNA ligase subunit beta [Mesomycoplasma flocculare]MXR56923.1 phenylalanine--tRNA ligase subunit beta [Mesomycoplasma flocculare]